jgi:branched-chain amino acid transport system substrate-binding protein
MPGMAAYASEGVIYAKHILATKPNAKIAILAQNDDSAATMSVASSARVGDKAATMIVSKRIMR